jgi:hypothetical protein
MLFRRQDIRWLTRSSRRLTTWLVGGHQADSFFHKIYVLGENENGEPIGKFVWETMGDGKDERTEVPDQSFDGR